MVVRQQGTAVPRPVLFGEILFDHFPDGSTVLGGAPLNVAWHLQAFGLRPLMISALGSDAAGRQALAALAEWGMDLSGIQCLTTHPTGQVDIRFEEGEPAYVIRENSAWDNIDSRQLPPLPERGLLYHGSLALRCPASRECLLRLKDTLPGSCFVDINLRLPHWSAEQESACFSNTDILKLNEAEFALLSGNTNGPLLDNMPGFLTERGLERLLVTRGEKGVLAIERDTLTVLNMPVTACATGLVDTVGAGDAFSSVCMLGACLGWPLPLTLERAGAFASAIVGVRGATVFDPAFYQAHIRNWEL